jgi:casein kinase II subunit beta
MVYPAMVPTKSPDLPPGAAGGRAGPGGANGDRDANASAAASVRPEKNGLSMVGPSASTAAVALRTEVYRPTIFGFQVNEIAKLQRWQLAMRDRLAFPSS